MFLADLGEAVRKQRKLNGMNQQDLAQAARISRATLTMLETGRLREIGFNKVSRLLFALGMGITIKPISTMYPTLEQLRMEDEEGEDELFGISE